MDRQSVYAIAVGSNRRSRHGSPAATVRAAIAALGRIGVVECVSAIRATPALGPAGRAFANAVVLMRTGLPPNVLLAELKRMERDFGRRGGRRWGPRVLDLDIILWSEGAWGGPGPIVPHPGYRGRRFVLEPLAEVAAGWRDPLTGLAVRHALTRLTAPRPAPR